MTEASTTRDGVTVAPTADVDARAGIGAGTRIWHLAQIREDASLGRDCNVGRGAYVGPGVVLGDNCKLQNHALVYEPARLGDGHPVARRRLLCHVGPFRTPRPPVGGSAQGSAGTGRPMSRHGRSVSSMADSRARVNRRY